MSGFDIHRFEAQANNKYDEQYFDDYSGNEWFFHISEAKREEARRLAAEIIAKHEAMDRKLAGMLGARHASMASSSAGAVRGGM